MKPALWHAPKGLENNYEEWLIIEAEQDPIKANTLEYAKIGYKHLKDTLNKTKYEY